MSTVHDRIKLVNARFVDVENGCYYPSQASLVIQNGKIESISGLFGEPDQAAADAVIDLHGLTVVPGLFNTHSHLQFIPKGEIGARQLAKGLHDCVDRGVTNVRDTLCYDLQENRAWMDKTSEVRSKARAFTKPFTSAQSAARIPPNQIHSPVFLSPCWAST